MADFTSALYLGLTHPAWSLAPWAQLTTGRPAVLGTTPAERHVASALAALTGCEAALLGSSTLHVFWDLFGMLGPRSTILMDAGAYPIARWGAQRAATRGAGLREFEHYDAEALRREILRSPARARPVVVADAFCPRCGRPAPIAAYLREIEARDGWLVLDDTQALGILGRRPPGQPHLSRAPYGHGGGGSLVFQNIESPRVVVVSSLAKAFGVPLAMLAGSARTVRRVERHSDVRVHTSPPSAAIVHAALRAVEINETIGDALRARLGRAVASFRSRLARAGLSATGGLFPVQGLLTPDGVDHRRLHTRLTQAGIATVLRGSRLSGGCVTLLITARHTAHEIGLAVDTLARAVDDSRAVNKRGTYERTSEL
jgi:8-amino-7-oxononanoate synthase